MRKILSVCCTILLLSSICLFTGCTKNTENKENNNSVSNDIQSAYKNASDQLNAPTKGEDIAIISTSIGDIKVKFFPEAAPKAVENFITHAKNGYYDGLSFHRVINEFMIQGGDPTGTGAGGESIWKKPFEDEFDNNLRNYRGALSMANAGPNTNGSQFFIVQAHEIPGTVLQDMTPENGFTKEIIDNYKSNGGTPWLDFHHTVFGQVFEGVDVVDDIAAIGESEKVTIKKITITTY